MSIYEIHQGLIGLVETSLERSLGCVKCHPDAYDMFFRIARCDWPRRGHPWMELELGSLAQWQSRSKD